MQESRPTLYASRRIERPVATVAADVETFLTRRSWQPVGESGPSSGPTASRAFRGYLYRASGTRIARVEVEVAAWSPGVTEIGLRPVGTRARRAATRQRYHEVATVLLEQLVDRPVRPAVVRTRMVPVLRRAS